MANPTRFNIDSVKIADISINVFGGKLSNYATVIGGMKNGMPVGAIVGRDKITTKTSGCGSKEGKDAYDEKFKAVAFYPGEYNLVICPREFEASLLAKGLRVRDMDSAEAGAIIAQLAQNGAERDLLRTAWIGSTAYTDATFNVATDKPNYNMDNGFYAQAVTAVSAGDMQKIDLTISGISANVLAAIDALDSAAVNPKIFATTAIYRALYNLVISSNNQVGQRHLENGIETLYIHGLEVVHLKDVSDMIRKDFATPFDFAIVTPQENLVIAMDDSDISPDSWGKDFTTRNNYLYGGYQADALIAIDSHAVLIAE